MIKVYNLDKETADSLTRLATLMESTEDRVIAMMVHHSLKGMTDEELNQMPRAAKRLIQQMKVSEARMQYSMELALETIRVAG